MVSEREKSRNIMRNMARGNEFGHKLKFDPVHKTVRPVPSGLNFSDPFPDPDGAIKLSSSDTDLFSDTMRFSGRLTVAAEAFKGLERGVIRRVEFSGGNDEHVFQLSSGTKLRAAFPGSLIAVDDPECDQGNGVNDENDKVRVLVKWEDIQTEHTSPETIGKNARAFVREGEEWYPAPLEVVPMERELLPRFGGFLEMDALADARVGIFGQESGYPHIAIGLAKSGVSQFDLIDPDRLEVCNVARHQCDLADIGRLKVNAMADDIKRKNP